MKLEQGKIYDTSKLDFAGWYFPYWQDPWKETELYGYNAWDYFDKEGRYLGPDKYGIEPNLFEIEVTSDD